MIKTALSLILAFATSNCFAQSGSLYRQGPGRLVQAPLSQPYTQPSAQPNIAPIPETIPSPIGHSQFAVGQPQQAFVPEGQFDGVSPLQAASWTFVPQPLGRSLKVHDIVSIRVEEIAQSTAEGTAQSRKTTSYDARVSEWVRLVGLDTLKPAKQPDGDPRIAGQESDVYRANSNMRTREQVSFNIAAEIADIRPNGSIVLSAHKNIRLNDNDWEVSLSGICRSQDIGPDNVIASKDILNLIVDKSERGHVRDGYSRGWFTKWLARFKPF